MSENCDLAAAVLCRLRLRCFSLTYFLSNTLARRVSLRPQTPRRHHVRNFPTCSYGWLAGLALLLLGSDRAPAEIPNDVSARSESGQFIVHEFKPGGLTSGTRQEGSNISTPGGEYFVFPKSPDNPNRDETKLRLTSPMVAMACDRVKRALLSTLGLRDDWTSEIHVFIDPNLQAGQISLTTVPVGRGSAFRLGIPPEMKELDLDRVVLHAVLLEKSNHGAGVAANNIPNWLTEGLVRCLRARDASFLSVQRINFLDVRPSQALALRKQFTSRQPLSFDELCWPESLDAEKRTRFTPSTELFVYELLNLPDGAICLGRMIKDSPNYLNWQFAFQNSFRQYFRRPVDVEKWWAVTWVRMLGTDPSEMWTYGDVWDKFDTSLRTTLTIQTNLTSRPVRKVISLQETIRDLPLAKQDNPLEMMLLRLHEVRSHVPRPVDALALQYQQVITNYLAKSARAGSSTWEKNQAPVNLNVLKQTICADLDQLDRKKARLKTDLRPIGENASLSR